MTKVEDMAGRKIRHVVLRGTRYRPADSYSISVEDVNGILRPTHIVERRRGLEWSPRVVGWARALKVISAERAEEWRGIVNGYRQLPVLLPPDLDKEFTALMMSNLQVRLPPAGTNLPRGRATVEIRAPKGEDFVTQEIFSRRRISFVEHGPKPS